MQSVPRCYKLGQLTVADSQSVSESLRTAAVQSSSAVTVRSWLLRHEDRSGTQGKWNICRLTP
jgi:hypothetical protein